jgi:hypothetical protein
LTTTAADAAPTRLVFQRWPQDRDELHLFTEVVFGVSVPRIKVCDGHTSPFEALAQAYFAEVPVALWHGSRGFGGKSFNLALLSVLEATCLGASVTILGGSGQQSMRVYEHMLGMWHHPYAPKQVLAGEPTRYLTRFRNGNSIVALTASQTSVRGPHPQRLRMDEIDEMDQGIFTAAMGQTMRNKKNPEIDTQTVASSTWQYPDKTMAWAMKEAGQKGWPVHSWCYRETSAEGGWLTAEEIERKRNEVPQAMWVVEYDLQEPSVEGRAIDGPAVDLYFDPELGEHEGALDEEIILEPPVPGARYVTGVDWAKTTDWTVIRTYRTDVAPWREVAFVRTGRKRWPLMVGMLTDRWDRYGGAVWHDATGLGNVIADYLPDRMVDARVVEDVQMIGRRRESLFSEYVSAIEQHALKTARIRYAYDEHRYATEDDFRSGASGHPPDSCVAGALAWAARHAADKDLADARPDVESFEREQSPWEGL